MKKKAMRCLLFLPVAAFLLSGCFGFIYDNDDSVARGKIDAFLTALDKGDTAAVKATFAPNTVSSLDNFDQQISDLLSYYQGEHARTITQTTGMEGTLDYGKVTQTASISTVFLTSKAPYRAAYTWCWRDDYDEKNIGISCLSIIRYYDDINREYAYWGGSDRTPGIHVGAISPAREESSSL